MRRSSEQKLKYLHSAYCPKLTHGITCKDMSIIHKILIIFKRENVAPRFRLQVFAVKMVVLDYTLKL